jgi:adenosylhomocysteine nucleosidase
MQQNVYPQSPDGRRRRPDTVGGFSCDIGVITVVSEETSAMTGMLRRAGRYRKRSGPGGLVFHEAEISIPGQTLRVAALQALEQGQQSAANAFHHLSQFCRPAITVLVGIAGAIHPKVAPGDVVVVQEVIYYDLRKEVPGKVIHRGSTRPVPAAIRRAANDFFSSRGEPYQPAITDLGGLTRTCSVWPGPIGSGKSAGWPSGVSPTGRIPERTTRTAK